MPFMSNENNKARGQPAFAKNRRRLFPRRLDLCVRALFHFFQQGFVHIAVRCSGAAPANDGHCGCREKRLSPATSIRVEYRYRQAQKPVQRHRAPNPRRSKVPRFLWYLLPLRRFLGIGKGIERLESFHIRIRTKLKWANWILEWLQFFRK